MDAIDKESALRRRRERIERRVHYGLTEVSGGACNGFHHKNGGIWRRTPPIFIQVNRKATNQVATQTYGKMSCPHPAKRHLLHVNVDIDQSSKPMANRQSHGFSTMRSRWPDCEHHTAEDRVRIRRIHVSKHHSLHGHVSGETLVFPL